MRDALRFLSRFLSLSVCLPVCLAANLAWSASPTSIKCAECRDVYKHPEDYGNFAYNSVFGSRATLGAAQGDLVKVIGPGGQWAIVDLNFVMQSTGLSVNIYFLHYAVALPNGRIQMVIQDPKGNITIREVYSRSPDLVVGNGVPASSAPEPEPATTTQPNLDNYRMPKTPSRAGPIGTPCCQTGEFYWYYDMPEFQIRTFRE